MPLKKANIPFDLWAGNHVTIVRGFTAKDVAGVASPIDLLMFTIYFTVFNGDVKLIEKSTVAGSVTVQGTGNYQISVTLTPAETRAIAAAIYDEGVGPTHEIEFRSGGQEETWIYGKIKLKGGDNVDAA